MFMDDKGINDALMTLRGAVAEAASKGVGPLDMNFTLGGDAGICVIVRVDTLHQTVRFSVEKFLTTEHTCKKHVAFDVVLNELPVLATGSKPTPGKLMISQPGVVTFRDYDADKAAQPEL